MPKPKKGYRLGGSASHQEKILANLATQLFEHESIRTTETKAKRLRPLAEKLITKAKYGTLANRRAVLKVVRDKDVVYKLFAEIGPKFAERNGGYTRIVKLENRKGDNAPMAQISLVTEETVSTQASRATRVAASRKAKEADTATPVDDSDVKDVPSESSAADSNDVADQKLAEDKPAEDKPVQDKAVESGAVDSSDDSSATGEDAGSDTSTEESDADSNDTDSK